MIGWSAGNTHGYRAIATSLPTVTTVPATQAPTVAAMRGLTGTTTPASSALAIRATSAATGSPIYGYDPNSLTVKAGTVSFFFSNVDGGGQKHVIAIGTITGQPLVQSRPIFPGMSNLFTIQGLLPGAYLFFCVIVDPSGIPHYKNGMVGKLTVTP